jgi:hypothetical protein
MQKRLFLIYNFEAKREENVMCFISLNANIPTGLFSYVNKEIFVVECFGTYIF